MELLNAILIVTNCKSAEELKDLSEERKLNLAHSLEERVPSGLASIEEWNELLMLLMNAPPESENKIAKKKLLCHLRGEEYKEELKEECKKKPAPANKNKWWEFIKKDRK